MVDQEDVFAFANVDSIMLFSVVLSVVFFCCGKCVVGIIEDKQKCVRKVSGGSFEGRGRSESNNTMGVSNIRGDLATNHFFAPI